MRTTIHATITQGSFASQLHRPSWALSFTHQLISSPRLFVTRKRYRGRPVMTRQDRRYSLETGEQIKTKLSNYTVMFIRPGTGLNYVKINAVISSFILSQR